MQDKMEKLRKEEAEGRTLPSLATAGQSQPNANTNVAPPKPDAPANDGRPPVDDNTPPPDNSSVVTFTREEANELRARAERTAAADGRAEVAAMEIAELRAALTAAEERAKGVTEPSPPAPSGAVSAPVADPGDVALTADEQEEYADSEKVITKIARREAATLINAVMKSLDERFKKVETGVTDNTTAVNRTAAQGFADTVKKEVPRFQEIIDHKHWKAFLESTVPVAGIEYREALANAHHKRSIEDMKGIFAAFTAKYLPEDTTSGAYSGMKGDGGEGGPAPDKGNKDILKISVRRKASEDFIKNRITAAELDVIKKAYELAEKEGRVDYSN
jgi:hypothetical protein